MAQPRVIIIGAGFGGLECARRLARRPVDVLLVDRNNYHLFTPLLYQVASALLNPSDIAYPVRAALRGAPNVRFRLAEVARVDLADRRVILSEGAAIPYDYLVLATGSRSHFFGLDEVERAALGLKDLPEALELRNHVLQCFEAASAEADPEARRGWLTFVVIGAGPTGVEYAGALSELVRLALAADHPELDVGQVRIVLVEAAGQVLPPFPPGLGEHARRELEGRGIEVRLGTLLEAADPTGVRLSGGERIAARSVIWAAGVRASAPDLGGAAPEVRGGRLVTDAHLRLRGQERVYVVGDLAAVGASGEDLPMTAPPAIQEGRAAAANVLRDVAGRPLVAFRYRDRGSMATIGRAAAVASIGPISLRGLAGWLAWLGLHLFWLIGFRNRAVVLLGWAWSYVRIDHPIRILARARQRDPRRPPHGGGPGAV